MTLMTELEMAQAVENICDEINHRSENVDGFDLESLFDNRTAEASISELIELCHRVEYRCLVNGIVLVPCDELSEGIQPWKIDYKVKSA